MFLNFKNMFNEQNVKLKKVPKDILKILSQNLPEGFEYINFGNNTCGLKVNENDKIEIPLDLMCIKKICNKYKIDINSKDDLLKYLYNSQKSLKIILEDSDILTINGTKINVKDIIIYPFKEDKEENYKRDLIIKPNKFPIDKRKIKLKIKNRTEEFNIIRYPHNSVNVILFKSIDKKCLKLSISLDTREESISLNLKTDISNAGSIKEIIESFEFYNDFCEGKIKLNEINMDILINNHTKKVEKGTIDYWKNIYEIEKKLRVSFNPSVELTEEERYKIKKIYISIIQKQPFKEYVNIKDGKIELNKLNSNKEIKDLKGVDLIFSNIEERKFNILGAEISIYSLFFIYNAVVVNGETKKSNEGKESFILYFTNSDETYRSEQFFITQEEAIEVQSNQNTKDNFKNAKIITLN